jgi:autotransporter-associated beta strand protein
MARSSRAGVAVLVAATLAAAAPVRAALTFTVGGTWPDEARRTAAVNALQSAVNRYNAYGNFGNYNVYAYYDAGIPTAQANYLGSIGYGGTYPNERVTMHEMSHYLGTGTYGTPWDGVRGEALIDQFDGLEAALNGDTQHYWPYGLNYDSEGAEINKQRHVALLYAMRADMGIGSTANPWSATVVNLTASDAVGESGFHYANTWSDARFAHPGAAYSTGNFILRTPASGNSFTFVGDSATVNNTNGINGGLLYKGTGATGVTTFKTLNLNGGYVRHASSSSDVFQLAGKVSLTQTATIDAAQGPVRLLAAVGGAGSLAKTGSFPLSIRGAADYAGDTAINAGILRLEPVTPVASYTFDNVSGSTVVNGGSGGAAMNGTLAGGATIVPGGRFGNALSVAGGASVNINNPIVDLSYAGNWTVSAWVKTSTAGSTILTKGDGGWANGNTIFYLGDGTAGGSGGIPSSVRWGGGFFQGSTAAGAVNNNQWRLVTYVNSGGSTAIYVDGVAQPLSNGNSGFANTDVGSIVRLGATTNTVAADGTVNFNGLLDSVQFYNQALSGPQIAALYQGVGVAGSLPSTTNVTIASGASLDLNGLTQQIGALAGPAGSAVTLGAGSLTVNSAANSAFGGTISGNGGSLVKSGAGTLTITGANSFSGGTTINGGRLVVNNTTGSGVGSGPTVVGPDGVLAGVGRVSGNVTNNGAVDPGLDADGLAVLGDFTQLSGGVLKIELASTARFDRLAIAGAATLAGKLQLILLEGFVPAEASFDILNWGSVSGRFDDVVLPSVPGFNWDAAQLETAGVLSLVPAAAADFDADGDVDADDLTRWQTGYGGPSSLRIHGNADGDDDVDGNDFLVWQRQLGAPTAATAGAVPEPAGFALALTLVAACFGCRRDRNS